MYLSVGGYNHALGEVGISIAKTVNQVNGTPRATTHFSTDFFLLFYD